MQKQSGGVWGGFHWFASLPTESVELSFMVQHDVPYLPGLLVGALPATSPNQVHFMIKLLKTVKLFSMFT